MTEAVSMPDFPGAVIESTDLEKLVCQCGKMLARQNIARGSVVEIKCPRCRTMMKFKRV